MSSYPRMLYRASGKGHVVFDGVPFATLAVECEAELVNALADDWLEVEEALASLQAPVCHPLDHDCDGVKGGSPAGENATRRRGRKPKQ